MVPLDITSWNQILDELFELRAIYDAWKSGADDVKTPIDELDAHRPQ
jgi:hypothetical protein